MVATEENFEAIDVEEKAPEELENSREDDDDEDTDSEGEPEPENEEDDGEDGDDDDEDDDDEDEEDPEDLQETLREKCQELPHCVSLKAMFDVCEGRVNSRQKTEENCTQELLDFVGCVDKCVSKSLFNHLK